MQYVAKIAFIAKEVFREVCNGEDLLELPFIRAIDEALPETMKPLLVNALKPLHYFTDLIFAIILISF